MALTTMTQEWTRIANNIMVFAIRERQKDEVEFLRIASVPTELYNHWVHRTAIAIKDIELVMWCTEYLQEMAKAPMSRLLKAAELDKLKI